MKKWVLGDVEMAIALKRHEVNNALQGKRQYDAEDHNICLALVDFTDNTFDVLAAYSNDSAIPESIRLGLGLIPSVREELPSEEQFGCDGRAQFHTEPKLLNYLCAPAGVREVAFQGTLPRTRFYRAVLNHQREQAAHQARVLPTQEKLASVTLVTEIDCCPMCTAHSLQRFRTRFPRVPLKVLELGKHVRTKTPPSFQELRITKKP